MLLSKREVAVCSFYYKGFFMWLQTGKPFGQQIENDPEAYFLLGTLSPEERRLLDPSDLRNAAALRAFVTRLRRREN